MILLGSEASASISNRGHVEVEEKPTTVTEVKPMWLNVVDSFMLMYALCTANVFGHQLCKEHDQVADLPVLHHILQTSANGCQVDF